MPDPILKPAGKPKAQRSGDEYDYNQYDYEDYSNTQVNVHQMDFIY